MWEGVVMQLLLSLVLLLSSLSPRCCPTSSPSRRSVCVGVPVPLAVPLRCRCRCHAVVVLPAPISVLVALHVHPAGSCGGGWVR
ncbi:hypothetical protein L208DRAFT_1411737, partial [Tricholoma matsutake]